MITQTDIQKLKEVFLTKEDLRSELRNELKKYATKEDMETLATKRDIQNIADQVVDFVSIVAENVQTSIDELKNHKDTLEHHERRINELEDKVYSATTNS